MKLFIVLFFLLSTSVFASHPHDMICVGASAGQKTSLVFQFAMARAYENGDPNTDAHIVNIELRSCLSDYGSDTCQVFRQDNIRVEGTDKTKNLVVELKNDKDLVLYKGNVNFADKDLVLNGKMNEQNDKGNLVLNNVKIKLTCVSQPWLNVSAEADDRL